MLSLADLLESPQGIDFLRSKGVFVVQNEFIDQLKIPVAPSLAANLGSQNAKLAYAGQQIYVDCTQSMISRIAILQDLEQVENVSSFFLWVDTDRSGSDKLITKFYWPLFGKNKPLEICVGAVKEIESRFVTLDPALLQRVIDQLGKYLPQTVKEKTDKKKLLRAKEKYDRLRTLFVQEPAGTLSEFNHQVTYFLLNNHLRFNPHSVILSDIINCGLLTTELNLFVNHLNDAIRVFNESVHSLLRQGIDPQVRPLSEDYLPVNFSCWACNRRLRLYRETQGNDHFAVATCKCGENPRFYMGSQTLTVDEIVRTKRWSPDFCLLIFLNDLVSGYVGGKSSAAYYGLVMKDVLEKVMNKRRVPVLIPDSLGASKHPPSQIDSLIYSYLVA
jgi:hypothetical protein